MTTPRTKKTPTFNPRASGQQRQAWLDRKKCVGCGRKDAAYLPYLCDQCLLDLRRPRAKKPVQLTILDVLDAQDPPPTVPSPMLPEPPPPPPLDAVADEGDWVAEVFGPDDGLAVSADPVPDPPPPSELDDEWADLFPVDE
jgi:hypothetical protein